MPKRHPKSIALVHGPGPLKERGLQSFRQGDYTGAIKLWSTLARERDSTIYQALAEACFRRALATRHPLPSALTDLRRATELLPGEARYWYHLGLTLHRANQLEEARIAYARAADLGLQRRGVSFVRGLAEIEHTPHRSLDTLPYLSPDDLNALAPIAALLRGEPQAVLTAVPSNWLERLSPLIHPNPTTKLWQGLAYLASGDAAKALATLTLPKGQQLRAGAEQVRVFYHGLAAAATGDPQAALIEWTAAARSASKESLPSRMSQGIIQLHAQRLYDLQAAGQWAELLKQAQAPLALTPGESFLLQISLIAANRLAVAAVQAGEWATALTHWQTMRDLLEAHPDLGPLPPVLRNLAIAREALEQWKLAAEAWAALLGTLPKRVSKKQASRLTADIPLEVQRVWLRRRVLDNYKRAGRPDQAIAYYKQAVKAAPDNLDLRLELASALLANNQTAAGRNELNRILDKDQKHISAHLLMADLYQARGEWSAAEQSLRHVLAVDPGHEVARRGIAQMMVSRGMDTFNIGRYHQAWNIYIEALRFSPTDPHVLVLLADTELVLNNAVSAQTHLDAALATGRVEAYADVFDCWVKHRNETEARKVVAHAETAGVASSQFYIDVGIACLTHGAPPPSMLSFLGSPPRRDTKKTKWEQWGRELIQHALTIAPNRAEALHQIVAAIGHQHPAAAIEYARQLAALEPKDPRVLMVLGLLHVMQQDISAAKDTLGKAERLARKQNQKELISEIANIRRQIGSPLFGMLGSLVSLLGPDFDEEEFL